MNDTSAKQQIVEKVKQSSNILVTVSSNPSVDDLSAALGLTLLLNKMDKHATAVFSGAIPPAITFLDPEKTFENTVDSLRDFIIALDKEKADHLRYKVDGEVVKIFITPYRTTISNDDLQFSQGDYNVELVLALGVKNRADLDTALAAHGRILHDAAVTTVTLRENQSDLGSIDWHDNNASSLSEMLVSFSEALKADKPLLDEQIATAFMTGIVSATDRFSNDKTSSRAMTIAAQLMAAGANQQLIAAKLQEANAISGEASTGTVEGDAQHANQDGTTDLSEGKSSKVKKGKAPKAVEPEEPVLPEPTPTSKKDGELDIDHTKETLDDIAAEVAEKNQEAAAEAAERKLAEQLQPVASTLPALPLAAPSLSVADLQKDLAQASADVTAAAEQPVVPEESSADPVVDNRQKMDEPTMGGTLNATAEQAAEDKRREEEKDRNHTLLSHGDSEYIESNDQPAFQSPINASASRSNEPNSVDIFNQNPNEIPGFSVDTAPTAQAAPIAVPGAAQVDAPDLSFEQTPLAPAAPSIPSSTATSVEAHEDARAAVDAALNNMPFNPSNQPLASVGAQPLGEVSHDQSIPPVPPLPPLPDFSTLPPLPPQPSAAAPIQPSVPSASAAVPPAPINSGLSGAVPHDKLGDIFGPAPDATAAPAPSDPGQFKIPGQQ